MHYCRHTPWLSVPQGLNYQCRITRMNFDAWECHEVTGFDGRIIRPSKSLSRLREMWEFCVVDDLRSWWTFRVSLTFPIHLLSRDATRRLLPFNQPTELGNFTHSTKPHNWNLLSFSHTRGFKDVALIRCLAHALSNWVCDGWVNLPTTTKLCRRACHISMTGG